MSYPKDRPRHKWYPRDQLSHIAVTRQTRIRKEERLQSVQVAVSTPLMTLKSVVGFRDLE